MRTVAFNCSFIFPCLDEAFLTRIICVLNMSRLSYPSLWYSSSLASAPGPGPSAPGRQPVINLNKPGDTCSKIYRHNLRGRNPSPRPPREPSSLVNPPLCRTIFPQRTVVSRRRTAITRIATSSTPTRHPLARRNVLRELSESLDGP